MQNTHQRCQDTGGAQQRATVAFCPPLCGCLVCLFVCLFFVCVCVFASTHAFLLMWVHIDVRVCMCLWRPNMNARYLP